MSLTTGLVAIKGDFVSKISEVFSLYKLKDTGRDLKINSWAEVLIILEDEMNNPNDNFQKRVVWFNNGWTIIEDLSLILSSDGDTLEKISIGFNTPVFSMVTQGTSNCYGFWYFESGIKRLFFNNDGETTENEGPPLAFEGKFNINEKAFYNDIHGVAKELGIDWNDAQNHKEFIVKNLENTAELNKEIEEALKLFSTSQVSKPWWKFW